MMARHRKRKMAARAAHAAGRDKRRTDSEMTADERRDMARAMWRDLRRGIRAA